MESWILSLVYVSYRQYTMNPLPYFFTWGESLTYIFELFCCLHVEEVTQGDELHIPEFHRCCLFQRQYLRRWCHSPWGYLYDEGRRWWNLNPLGKVSLMILLHITVIWSSVSNALRSSIYVAIPCSVTLKKARKGSTPVSRCSVVALSYNIAYTSVGYKRGDGSSDNTNWGCHMTYVCY